MVVAFTVFIVKPYVGREKSMCVAAKGSLQGRAATLLLLCGWLSFFFFVIMQQKFHCHCVVVFFRLACNGLGYA